MTPVTPISVFLFIPHQLLLEALSQAIASQAGYHLVGSTTHEAEIIDSIGALEASPDIVVLQAETESSACIEVIVNRFKAKAVVLSAFLDLDLMDHWVLAGAKGILGPDVGTTQFFKALLKVHEGELWLDRFTTSRIVGDISKKKHSGPAVNPIDGLTDREKGIFWAILDAEGQPLREVAASLFISEFTLRNHLTAIYSKLGVSNRLELYVFTRQNLSSRPAKA